VRNSSLVQGFCAENVTGLKSATEASDSGSRIQEAGSDTKKHEPRSRRQEIEEFA
jgi:hypothetical protein